MENNQISFIEINSLSNLVKLETLILSANHISALTDISTFCFTKNLKLLNLSVNQLEMIPSMLFDSLIKLETLDLSSNKIVLLQAFSFNNLVNLRNIYLEENDPNLEMKSNLTFTQFESVQNIYLSTSILNIQNNVRIILNLFEEKKKTLNKTVLKRAFFKSLFLISNYAQYDCNLALFFLRNNVHFNFKTETHIFDYFNECSLMTIKNSIR